MQRCFVFKRFTLHVFRELLHNLAAINNLDFNYTLKLYSFIANNVFLHLWKRTDRKK